MESTGCVPMEGTNCSVPDNVKVEIRATLLSKLGGVVENSFAADFYKLNKYYLKVSNFGFQSVNDMMTSMPDVAR